MQKQTTLYAVLNWGLGHASRSIPIIKKKIAEGEKIIIASDGDALRLLQKEFPQQIFETLPAYNVHYAKRAKDFDKTFFFQLVKLGKAIKKEQERTKELIGKYNISQIISDNRYGVYHQAIDSVIICHQMNLQHQNTFVQKQMNKVHFGLLNSFHQIWIPDFQGEKALAGNISQTISKKLKPKIKYIGAVSRFKKEEIPLIYDKAIVLSGPEPQRTILENILAQKLKNTKQKIAFVRGISSAKNKLKLPANVEVFDLVKSKELNKILNQSQQVVCRAGYSSVMDLVCLNKKAMLIPTPGQTEQEYLAKFLQKNHLFRCVFQENLETESIFQ